MHQLLRYASKPHVEIGFLPEKLPLRLSAPTALMGRLPATGGDKPHKRSNKPVSPLLKAVRGNLGLKAFSAPRLAMRPHKLRIMRSLKAAFACEKQEKIGCLWVIARNKSRLLCSAGAGCGAHRKCNCSLTAGRDCPVITGNPTASAGKDFLDY
jgi:hypothetical protein